MSWNRKHLLDIESLTAAEITTVLDTALAFKAVGERAIKEPALRGKDRRQPVHRAVHPHPHELRAVRAAAFGGHYQLHRRGFLAAEGRDPQGHRAQPGGVEH